MVWAAGFEPAISAFQARQGRPNSPTPSLGAGRGRSICASRFIAAGLLYGRGRLRNGVCALPERRPQCGYLSSPAYRSMGNSCCFPSYAWTCNAQPGVNLICGIVTAHERSRRARRPVAHRPRYEGDAGQSVVGHEFHIRVGIGFASSARSGSPAANCPLACDWK